ncbi:MAG: biotin-dependent carboxyltransferase family protein [Granulosicoccus sp.]
MNGNEPSLNVVRAGLFSSIQDSGRFGLRHLGIPWAGVLSPAWQRIANSLVGNPADHPVIECFEGGLQLQACGQAVHLSIVGCDAAIIKSGFGGTESVSRPNRTITLAAGDNLFINSTGTSRHVLIAVAGIAIEDHLGSASTYAKASLGGLNGNTLQSGDVIRIRHSESYSSDRYTEQQCHLPKPLQYQASELRALPGPQFDHFSKAGIESFLASDYELGSETDRMGVRLHGAEIEHRDSSAKDIVSDAILPGSIQVPGAGQPIVMLNDSHTAGGYPKIATIISCDLPLLGIQRAGASFRFRLIDIDEAIMLRHQMQTFINECLSSFTPCIANELDTETLLSCNLIDGVTDGS